MIPTHMSQNGFIKDRCFRTDGFIIRAKATIRTDGFIVRAGFGNPCALRAPTSFLVRIKSIRTRKEVLNVRASACAFAGANLFLNRASRKCQ